MTLLLSLLIAHVFASEAVDKATEAVMIQSGLQGNLERFTEYLAARTPDPAKSVITLYKIYNNRCVKFPINNVHLEIRTDNVQVRIPL